MVKWLELMALEQRFVVMISEASSEMGIYIALLHSEWQKLYGVLAILSAIGLKSGKVKGSKRRWMGLHFSYAVPKILWGSNNPLPVWPHGFQNPLPYF